MEAVDPGDRQGFGFIGNAVSNLQRAGAIANYQLPIVAIVTVNPAEVPYKICCHAKHCHFHRATKLYF